MRVMIPVLPNTERLGAGETWKCLVNGLWSVNYCCTFHLGKEGSGKAEGQRALQHCSADRRHCMGGGENGRWVGPAQGRCPTGWGVIMKRGNLLRKQLSPRAMWPKGIYSVSVSCLLFFSLMALNLNVFMSLFLAHIELTLLDWKVFWWSQESHIQSSAFRAG